MKILFLNKYNKKDRYPYWIVIYLEKYPKTLIKNTVLPKGD